MKILQRPLLPGVDAQAALAEARHLIGRRVEQPARRAFLQRTLTLGGLSMLTGCSISDNAGVEAALTRISQFNDKVQGLIFDPAQLAPTYPESMITRPFPFNAYYGEDEIRQVDEAAYRLEVTGLVADKRQWTLPELRAMQQTDQVTRHICVEGWSAIGKWGGVRFSDFLARVGADTSAKFIGFKCADDYFTSIDMPTALHPQTFLALRFADRVLPPKYGFPLRLRAPTKLGFKNPKHIQEIFVSNTHPGGYWEDQGYNWFSGS